MDEVAIAPAPPGRFDALIGPLRAAEFAQELGHARAALEGHTFWHVNSTERGGGVAEMLQSVLSYLSGAGMRTRWLVIDGDGSLFEVTKRLHFMLHGQDVEGGPPGAAERAAYEHALRADVGELAPLVRPG